VILTVTLNAALDRTLAVPNFEAGFRHRASETLSLPGGKGVNVARVVKTLGQPVIASGFVGGRTGDRLISELEREDILCDFVRILEESRTSTAVLDPARGTTTEINEHGPEVSPREVSRLCGKLGYLGKATDVVVLAGSLPRGIDASIYHKLIGDLRRSDLRVFLDTGGDPLRHGLKGSPDVVFANQVEAETVIGHEIITDEEFVLAAKTLRQMGARSAVVHSKERCIAQLECREGLRTFINHSLNLEVVSSVGSGDSLLGGYAAKALDKWPPEECLRFGLGCAAANTLRFGAGVFVPEDAVHYADMVEIEEVQEVEA
jgi:1-phosphofructokinase/tagatose 6-phosphate kinase